MGLIPDQIWHLRGVFIWFQAKYGLKINLNKSELVPVGHVPNVTELACILGCRVSALPFTYLGLPLGASLKKKEVWDSVVEKMEKHLGGWKQLYLSKEGRLTLNMVGLGKWLLRYGFEFEFLWLRVVDSKLGSQGGWCSNQVSEPNGVGL